MAHTPDNSRVFLAAGDDGLFVVDAGATALRHVDGIGRAMGVEMGADGRTVWVGLPRDRQIAAVDTTTLTVRARYDVGSDLCPGDVAQTGPYVAFSFSFSCILYNDESTPPPSGVGVLDTRTGVVLRAPGDPWKAIVAASSAVPGRVFVTQYLMHEVTLDLLDLRSGSHELTHYRKLGMADPTDLAVSPDGSLVAVSGAEHATVATFATSDLSPSTSYQAPCPTRAVAWSADSSKLAASCNLPDTKLLLYDRGNSDPVATARLELGPRRAPDYRDLVLDSDAGRAIVASRAEEEGPMHYVDRVGLRPAAATVTGPATATCTRTASFTAKLLLGGAPAPAGTPLSIYREQPYNSTLLGTYPTDSTGTVTFTDAPPSSGTWSYRAHFAGNENYTWTDGAYSLQVDKLPTSLSVTYQTGKTRHHTNYGSVVVTLGPTVGHRSVTVTATTAAGTVPVTSASVPTDGPLVVSYPITGPTTFTATYEGSIWQQAANAITTASP
ncbi:YncE family protein [Micromonospora kangleipakensis]|nr:Ig-like domain repeat protein [Micromonospora kangleipakensis]